MFSSYHLAPVYLGPLSVYPWGVFVSAGFLFGLAAAFWFLKKHKAGAERIFDLLFWIILSAFVGSRLFHVLFYEPVYFLQHPEEIWQVWQGGLSSFGGILGGVLAGLIYLRKSRLNFWRYVDALAFAFPLGWILGRLGCFFTHQHLGVKSRFFLSVLASDGQRLEMSMIEAVIALLIFLLFMRLVRRTRPRGLYVAALAVFYGGARFVLDFFRSFDLPSSDARYLGLTPAQYVSAILFVFGAVLAWKIFRKTKEGGGGLMAVIYDMDDTMVNSQPLHALATCLVLKEYGRVINKEERSEFVGRRVVDVLAILKKELNLSASLDELFTRREKIFLDLARNKLEILPGLKQSLEFFKKNNFKIALASSAVGEYIDLALDKFNLKNYFEVIIAGDMVKQGKPDPETYIGACQKLNLPPAQCLVLEDSRNGIESAKRAGCLCLAIKNKYTPPQDRSEADVILNSLEEVDMKVMDLLR
ncbi:MAG: HAD-IA family hydrolase [bacterium]|nr:HAD-IA family hydrolase [bacterium]